MKRGRKPKRDEVVMPDLRADWQKAQAARCGCRGSDDLCPCQNAEEPWKYGLGGSPPPTELQQAQRRIRELEGHVSTLELQQKTDRQTIGHYTAPAPSKASQDASTPREMGAEGERMTRPQSKSPAPVGGEVGELVRQLRERAEQVRVCADEKEIEDYRAGRLSSSPAAWRCVADLDEKAATSLERLAIQPAPPGEGGEIGWLIEDETEPKWWTGWPGSATDAEFWTRDSLEAIRFSRRQDAESFALWHMGEGPYRITEHAWNLRLASPQQPAPDRAECGRGWRLAPVEPTHEMAAVGGVLLRDQPPTPTTMVVTAVAVFRAMLAAAPPAPSEDPTAPEAEWEDEDEADDEIIPADMMERAYQRTTQAIERARAASLAQGGEQPVPSIRGGEINDLEAAGSRAEARTAFPGAEPADREPDGGAR